MLTYTFQGYSWGNVSSPPKILEGWLAIPQSQAGSGAAAYLGFRNWKLNYVVATTTNEEEIKHLKSRLEATPTDQRPDGNLSSNFQETVDIPPAKVMQDEKLQPETPDLFPSPAQPAIFSWDDGYGRQFSTSSDPFNFDNTNPSQAVENTAMDLFNNTNVQTLESSDPFAESNQTYQK